MARSGNSSLMYVYDLPYSERRTLCDILDVNDKWEELGGAYMKFGVLELEKIKRECYRSHTDVLLQKWGNQNHTVLELFILLSRMQHYQAMLVLKCFVDAKYHKLIYEGEEIASHHQDPGGGGGVDGDNDNGDGNDGPFAPTMFPIPANAHRLLTHTEKDMGIGVHNWNKPATAPRSPKKVTLPLESETQNNTHSIVQDVQPPQENRVQFEVQQRLATAELCIPVINYSELVEATRGWDKSSLRGQGGFGKVFEGIWKRTRVAVKKLESQDDASEELLEALKQQSLKELKCLTSFRHKNILQLYGYSVDGEAPCLVYEFMENGSLEDRLQCRQGSRPLSWCQRYNIAKGIAGGLQYLHSLFKDKPLVHGDIKSANILLDPWFVPKIGDFGLAREGPTQQYTHVKVSKVHGTRPYLPAELLRGGKLSVKVDTYSFGIVLFEIATGLRAYSESRHVKFLKDFVESHSEAELYELADSKAGCDVAHIAPALLTIGKDCVKRLPSQRPDMILVHQQLDKLGSAIEQTQKAHDLLRQNEWSPTTPYQQQLLYDHTSQQRALSIPDSTAMPAGTSRCVSPRPVSPNMIPTVVQESRPTKNPHVSVIPPSEEIQEQNGAGTHIPNGALTSAQNGTSSPFQQELSESVIPMITALGIKTSQSSE